MYKRLGMMILIFLLMGAETQAASPAGLVATGNRLYSEGKYDEALAAYEAASVKAPEAPWIYFDKGAAYYRKGDMAKAKAAFENAALKTKDIKLEAMARFNLGNCAFKEAQRQADGDSNKALEACQTSIRHYQEALALDPESQEAGENVEVVRLVMKNILDEIHRQKEAAKKNKTAVDKLKRLIQQQQALADRTHKLSIKKDSPKDNPGPGNKMQKLADEQKAVEKETRDLETAMPRPVGKSPPVPSKGNAVKRHLENAAGEQARAAGKLTGMQAHAAEKNQKNALNELNNALVSLSSGNKRQGKQNPQKALGPDKNSGRNNARHKVPDGKDQNQEQNKITRESQSRPPNSGAGKEKQPLSMVPEDARSILDQEKKNLYLRSAPASGGYSKVVRDW